MKYTYCEEPLRALATEVAARIDEHSGDTLCFLAGGSALGFLEHLDATLEEQGAVGDQTEVRDVAATQVDTPDYSIEEDSDVPNLPQGHFMSSNVHTHEEEHSRAPLIRKKGRTIFMMGDERQSRENDISNYGQLLTQYEALVAKHDVIDTRPAESELAETYAARLSEKIFQIQNESDQLQIICILGIGPDGHTAGIFPLTKKLFDETYRADTTYVPVQLKSLTIDSRASLTPHWILKQADYVYGYTQGQTKEEIVRKLIYENLDLHTMPAQILKQHMHGELYTNIRL